MKPVLQPCSMCGTLHPPEVLHPLDDQQLCPDCLEEHAVMCFCCGEHIWEDDNAGTENIPLCRACYDRYYTECSCCGRLIANEDARYLSDDPEDDEEPLCDDCYTRSAGERAIHDYFYKPEPIFYGKAARFLGVELEIDGGGECNENANRVQAVANPAGTERIYCKHDGSLDDGFEIVTHPMTLAYHEKEMPWEAVLDEAKSMGYTSHQAGTCGLHVHVNRDSFGPTQAQQDACIARVLYFFEKHWEELRASAAGPSIS